MGEKKEIQVYVYDKSAINRALELLKIIKVEGFEQAQVVAELGKIVCSPLQEGIANIADGEKKVESDIK